jgi:Caudovirus prohead serine protease
MNMHTQHRDSIDIKIATRLLDLHPTSFDDDTHTVEAILSKGSPVQRVYGVESLRISKDAIDLSRLSTSGIPILDSHKIDSIDAALGKLQSAWVANGALHGRIKFNQTDAGIRAEGMVARGELGGISVGYKVTEWEVRDDKGKVIDPDSVAWGGEESTFVGRRWELLEVSLVSCPADTASGFRNQSDLHDRVYFPTLPACLNDVRTRMEIRQRIMERQAEFESCSDMRDDDLRTVRLPRSDLIFYGNAETM